MRSTTSKHGRQATIWICDLVWPRARELTQATCAHGSITLQKQEKIKSPLVILFENCFGLFETCLLLETRSQRTRIFVAKLWSEGIETHVMSRLFVAWKLVSVAGVTGRIKMEDWAQCLDQFINF